MRCGLLGQTLAHSHSPLLHSLLGDYAYTLFEKAPDQVEDFLKNGPWDGLNVTIPYKKTAYALCDSLSPIARETGNVNTLLRRRDGSIFGDNTRRLRLSVSAGKGRGPRGREAGPGAGRRRSRRHRMRRSAADGRRRHRAIPHGKAR